MASTIKNKHRVPQSKQGSSNKQKALKRELKEMSGISTHSDYIRFTVGMLLVIVSLFLLLAIISNIFTGGIDQAGVMASNLARPANYAGRLGAYAAHYIMGQLFGVFSVLLPIFLLALALKLFMRQACPIRLWVFYLHLSIIMVVGSIDANFIQDNILPESIKNLMSFELGGMHGKVVLRWLSDNIGVIATGAVLLLLTISYIGYWFTQVFIAIFKGIQRFTQWILPQSSEEASDNTEERIVGIEENDEEVGEDAFTEINQYANDLPEDEAQIELSQAFDEPLSMELPNNSESDDTIIHGTNVALDGTDDSIVKQTINLVDEDIITTSDVAPHSSTQQQNEIKLSVNATQEEESSNALTAIDVQNLPPIDPRAELSRYKFPPLSLLEKHDAGNVDIDMEEQHANKNRIIQVLGTFGVKITQISATVGPTVTLYEITPAPGVRIAKIKNLEEDIALTLAAIGIRIIAPIPGKGTIGIEVPNKKAQIVSMESILKSKKFQESNYALPVALGKTITNEIFMVDLAKMPHRSWSYRSR